MSGKTGGQAAYEEFCRQFPYESWGPWESLKASIDGTRGWEAVAAAGVSADTSALEPGERDLVLSDLGEMLEALGLGDYARPESPHEVFGQCIAAVRQVVAENQVLRDVLGEIVAARYFGISEEQWAAWGQRVTQASAA